MAGSSPNPLRAQLGRKAFKRTQVSMTERVTGLSLVALLVGIGVAVWIQGRNFDPGLYSPRSEALKSAGVPIAAPRDSPGSGGIAQEAAKPESGSPEESGEASSPSVVPTPAKGDPIEISGTKPMGATEFYSPDTLYEKIDGRAPAYLEFHFQQLRSRSFARPENPGSYADVYEYRMDSPVNAFGIFALERDPAGKPLDFAPDGYSGDMGFFFRRGNCYVQVIASDQKPGTLTLAKAVAEQMAKSIPPDDAGLNARRRLPAQGLVPGTITFTQANAQGQAFLKEVFQADYNFEGKKISFFLMVTTPEAAAKAWESFLAFSGRYGGKAETLPDIGGAKVFQAQNFGKWKFIYERAGELGGVVDGEDPVAARAFLEKVLQAPPR